MLGFDSSEDNLVGWPKSQLSDEQTDSVPLIRFLYRGHGPSPFTRGRPVNVSARPHVSPVNRNSTDHHHDHDDR